MPVTPAFGRLRQEYHPEFNASLGYTVSPVSKPKPERTGVWVVENQFIGPKGLSLE